MSDIGDYLSQKDEIERLNKQLDMVAGFYSSFFSNKIKLLERRVKQQREMRYKERKRKEALENKQISVLNSLIKLKYKKDLDLTVKDIAELAFVSEAHVYKQIKKMVLGGIK